MSRYLLAAGTFLFGVAVVLALTFHHSKPKARIVTVNVLGRSTTSVRTTTAKQQPPAPLPQPPIAFSWSNAGALIVHPGDIDPAWLAQQMRAAGFGWVALQVNDPVDPGWIARFRQASGNMPVGGWSVLGQYVQYDAAQAAKAVQQYGLSFYIADAEAPYGYTDLGTTSSTRFARSRVFVANFRNLEPTLPAAVSSYCRPDMHDLDWNAWVKGGFDFLPQAYVNDFGMAAAPRTCANGAAKWFPKSKVHPVIGSYSGLRGIVPELAWAQLLHAAGTTGFSIYPAEAGMTAASWQTFGQNLTAFQLATRPG